MRTTKHTLLTAPDVSALLSKQIEESGSQARWCLDNQVSTAYLSDVLNGRREPGKKILDVLGLESVTHYRPKCENMINQSNKSTGQQRSAEQEARLYSQWEIAKTLYAAHRLLVNAPPLNQDKIVAFLRQALIDFSNAGGNAQSGVDTFGQRGPVLFCEDGTEVPYDAGRMLTENYISTGLFR